MKAWTSTLKYSLSQVDIETMCHRPKNGDFVFGFDFVIVHSFLRSAGMYGINPLLNAISCNSLGAWRMSTRKPLTSTVHTIGSSRRLGKVQFGSSWYIFSILRIAASFAAP